MLEVITGEGPKPEIEIDEEKYTLSPLRIEDFGKFRDWVKKKRLSVFMEAANEAGMDTDQFNDNIQDILNMTPDAETESDPILEEMGTEEGMVHLIYLSIKREHPEVEKSDLDLNFSDLMKLTSVIGEISGLPQGENPLEGMEEVAENNETGTSGSPSSSTSST